MFKIYSLALLSFLTLQNCYAADQKEDFPGEAVLRAKLTNQQREIECLQHLFKSMFKNPSENVSPLSRTLSSSDSKDENTSVDDEGSNLTSSSNMKLEHEQKIKQFERNLDRLKSNLYKEGEYIIAEKRHEIRKLDMNKEFEEKKVLEHKASYQDLGIAFRLALKDGAGDLPESEKWRFMFNFPLTFWPSDDETSVRLHLSKEDQDCLDASGENQDLVYNLMSSINTEIKVLHDMIQRGFEIRKQQS